VNDKKKTRIKKLKLTSVDMVRRGANQDAYINLYKSDTPPEAPETDKIPQSLWKSLKAFVTGIMKATDDDRGIQETEPITKADEAEEALIMYQGALFKSIDSILRDEDTENIKKAELVEETLEQFKQAYIEKCATVLKEEPSHTNTPDTIGNTNPKGEREMRIDKSRFNADELKTYEALIAKGLVDDNDPRYEKEKSAAPAEKVAPPEVEYEMEEDEPDDDVEVEVKGKAPMDKACHTRKSAMHPEVVKALQELQEMKKSMEINELKTIAKKYEPIGKRADELAYTLYDMKKSGEANYDEYLAILDENLAMVEKSGMFDEIGKSARGMAGGSTVQKIEQIATDIQKSDPSMGRLEAVNKAWELHPELIAEYESTL
jgi:hypothetical protein